RTFPESAHRRVRLAWRTSMNGVERREIHRRVQSIALDEPKRIARLRLDVDANHVETGAVITDRATASAAEQVQKQRTPHPATLTKNNRSRSPMNPAPACGFVPLR